LFILSVYKCIDVCYLAADALDRLLAPVPLLLSTPPPSIAERSTTTPMATTDSVVLVTLLVPLAPTLTTLLPSPTPENTCPLVRSKWCRRLRPSQQQNEKRKVPTIELLWRFVYTPLV
jgi:hypothetical protein